VTMTPVGDCEPTSVDGFIVVASHCELVMGDGCTVLVRSCVPVMVDGLIGMDFGLATAAELIVTGDGFTVMVWICGLGTTVELFVIVWNWFATGGSTGEL
jgi:hypothetical protein